MTTRQNSAQELLAYLRSQGPTLSSELVAHFGLSRQTLSRRVQELGDALVTIGKGRATRLAARHADWSKEVPLYQVQESGQVELSGHLNALQAGTQTQWYLVSGKIQSSLIQDEFKNGLFPGWPWFLEDLRPAGFLGRAFGKLMAGLFLIDEDPEKWDDIELLKTLTFGGSNLQGNFILDDSRALSEFQKHKIQVAEGYHRNTTTATYPEKALKALSEGENYGSSAGGEQPKFTTMVCETPESAPRPVIVKFSPKLDTAAGQRWSDLLHAEDIANHVLSEADFATAHTRILQIENRVFLESERYDRVGHCGRKGLVTLRALDAAYIGMGSGSWADVGRRLHRDRWISEVDRDRMIQLHCFGELIANTDMHWGNLSFFLPETPPFPLAPVYDMLPMRFRPGSTGEIIQRQFEPRLPKPEDQKVWLEMYPHALGFWKQVSEHPDISKDFKAIANAARISLKTVHTITAQ